MKPESFVRSLPCLGECEGWARSEAMFHFWGHDGISLVVSYVRRRFGDKAAAQMHILATERTQERQSEPDMGTGSQKGEAGL